MQVVILGESAPYPAPGGATAGCLVQTDEGVFLIDCGSGVFAEMVKHISLSELKGVMITHYHADHVADLGILQYAAMVERMRGKRQEPLIVFANQNPPEKFQDVSYGEHVKAVPLQADSRIRLCGCDITFADTNHAVPCLAIAVEANGKKFVFSGDTGPSESVEALARNADLFLCEVTWMIHEQGSASVGHLTTQQAAEMAIRANVKNLCLTHIDPEYDREELRKEAEFYFRRNVHIASKGMVWEIN